MGRPDQTAGERAAATTSTLPRATQLREAAVTLSVGDSVGRYRVLEVLGAGGMGVVYGAFDPELQRKVALKLVRAEITDAELRARLWREAQAMARIRHPNVITVFDVGTWNDQMFVTMEVIDGWTLTSWQAARSRSVDEILRVFVAAGAGLAAAHAVGLVHRDFKPDNILIGGDGRVCVTDFGLARVVAVDAEIEEPSSPDATVEGELTRQGAVVGTPAYMAPEQMRGTPPDGRADQFSFCVALFEALYGVRPFPGKSLGELERAIFDEERLRPRRKGVPANVRRALARGLGYAANERFDSMDALLRALRPAPRMLPAGVVAGIAAVAVAAVAAVAGVTHWRDDRARLCGGAGDRLAGVWDGDRRAQVAAALGDGVDARGHERASRVLAALDDYAARWVRGYTDACEATRVRGEQSEALLDLRMQCLDGRRREAEELTRILATDKALGDKAVQAVKSLPSVAACNDVAALARPRPTPAAARAEIEVPRRLLARARAELNALECKDARANASAAAAQARTLDDSTLAAAAMLQLARAQRCLGELGATRTTLIDGAVQAARAHDEVELTFLTSEAVEIDAQQAEFADAEHWVALGDDAVAHAGGDAWAEADHLYARAILEWRRNHLAEAVELHQRAATRYDRIEDGGEYDRLRNLGQLASVLGSMGRFAEARPLEREIRDRFAALLGPDSIVTLTLDENIALDAWEAGDLATATAGARRFLERMGAASPSHVSTAQANYGWMLIEAHRLDEAVSWLERALASAERVDGRHDEETEFALAGLGAAYVARGEPARALPPLERALGLQHGDETAADCADTELALAQALTNLGRDAGRAQTLAEAARDYYKTHPFGVRRAHQLAAAEAWLRAHPARR
ncbi:MAG TPA: serine/threonine-protein kinase [Polyangia bacterium]|nr:serine/threonine-protein kinase [Polyangia bacterium]